MAIYRIGNIIIEIGSTARFGYRCGSGFIAAGKKCRPKPKTYTKPKLRDKLKRKIVLGAKGGKSGQWSARKAQLLALAYKAAGGGYRGGKNETQESLKTWGSQDWQTRDGKPAIRTGADGKTVTARYLPSKNWDGLTKGEAIATDRKKRRGAGQFVSNTRAARGS